MGIPQVAIVGRPNVGKSSILNWIAGKRVAIVDDRPGVTRDRLSYLACHDDRYFELIDTGGMGFIDQDNLTQHIEDQINLAIEAADMVLLVVDARQGVASLDLEVAERLRNLDVPMILLANKVDHEGLQQHVSDFFRLGHGDPLDISTKQNRNRSVLLDQIVAHLPPPELEEDAGDSEPTMKVAIVGRRNVGKSTFVNTLVQEPRMIVSEIPGTTRDSVDVRFELDGKAFVAIDTPGIRRTRSQKGIDFYGAHRAQRSVRRADVVFLFLDATVDISRVDKQLGDYICQQYKPCVFVVNKWDQLVGKVATEEWVEYLHNTFRTMRYVPIAFITGQTGKNVKALLNHGQMLFKQSRQRVTTSRLNRMLIQAVKRNPPPTSRGQRPKLYFGTQAGIQPPTLVLFCNNPNLIAAPYQRYLLSTFRDELSFDEVPIKLFLRKRTSSDLPTYEFDAEEFDTEESLDDT